MEVAARMPVRPHGPIRPGHLRPVREGALPFRAPAKYQLFRVLGTGGMGTVVLARDRNLGRLVALKFLHESCELFLERFRIEARVMARLAHPAIVPVHEFDTFEGRPYLALDYVDGGNLTLAELEPAALVDTLMRVVDALGHAHAHGVVHRDVKPENILLDRRGRAFLTDFGLALGPGEGRFGGDELPIAGTPLTMSPEQIRGERVGPASDVFSFGATLYRTLTGRWPFQGRTTLDVLDAVQHDRVRPVRELAPAVPRAIESAVLRCLEKDARDRFESMACLGDALARRSLWTRAFERVRNSRRTPRMHTGPRIHPEELS